tara:strand:+ start:1496 stop:1726 length:231 start_codon:yes stop_codon:yes gene_type:complete
MNIDRLNLYKRLSDFKVPLTILDNLFNDDDAIAILENAYNALIDDGFSKDEATGEISNMIFKELKIEPDQSLNDEK